MRHLVAAEFDGKRKVSPEYVSGEESEGFDVEGTKRAWKKSARFVDGVE